MERSQPATLTLEYEDVDALEADYASNLSAGRAFVPGATDVAERASCELIVGHPVSGASLRLAGEAVWVKTDEPGAGVGLVLVDFDAAAAEQLRAFVEDGSVGKLSDGPQRKSVESRATRPGAEAGGGSGGRRSSAEPDNVYARVRLYDASQQLRAAREGDYSERVALERVYGKVVWDVLLHNPRITAPEITRMARNPKLPKQLLETITGNPGWLSSSELRRSLLKNPALSGASLEKVLRAMPKLELTTIARQSSYPMAVRQAIKRMQGRL